MACVLTPHVAATVAFLYLWGAARGRPAAAALPCGWRRHARPRRRQSRPNGGVRGRPWATLRGQSSGVWQQHGATGGRRPATTTPPPAVRVRRGGCPSCGCQRCRAAHAGRRPHSPPSASDLAGATAFGSQERGEADGGAPTYPCCTQSANPNRPNGVEGGARDVPPYKKNSRDIPGFLTQNPRRPGIPGQIGFHGAIYPGFRGAVWSRSRKSLVDPHTGARVDRQRQPTRFLGAHQTCGPPRGGTPTDSDKPASAVSPPLTVVSERTVPPFGKWRVGIL